MFRVTRPGEEDIRRWLAGQEAAPLPAGGASRRHVVDHNRIRLGVGPVAFDRACAALRRWEMFRLGWVSLFPPDAPLRVGTTVAVVVRHLGFWSLNPCRIVRLVEDSGSVSGPVARFGFAYRTLPDHAVDGEEQFIVEWSREDDAVAYDLRAWSRPRHPLAWIGLPVARRIQRQFARDSQRAMVRAVGRP